MSECFILPNTLKMLVDSKTESRQKGVQDVASKTAALFRELPVDEAYDAILRELRGVENILLKTTAAAYRRGGLNAVRAILSALPSRIHPFALIECISTLVFNSVSDVDASVRLAAFEAAHELVRRLQAQLLGVCFVEVFRGITCGIGDKDNRVVLVAREVSAAVREIVTGNDSFTLQMELFVGFVTDVLGPYAINTTDNVHLENPVVYWCLEWIHHVLDLPGDGLIVVLWRFLKPLLFLSGHYGSEITRLMQKSLRDVRDAFGRNVDVHLSSLLSIAATCVEEAEVSITKKNALEFILELIDIGTSELVHLTHEALSATLPQLGSKVLETRVVAQNVNNRLMQIVASSNNSGKHVPCDDILSIVTNCLVGRGTEETRVSSLEWITLVLCVDPEVVRRGFADTFAAVLLLLCDQSAHVTHKSVETLCLISSDEHFNHFITRLVDLFHAKADVLLPKVPTIIKQLQLRYQDDDLGKCEKLCLKLAEVLSLHSDKRFVEKVVITLNTMLLSSREFLPLREILRCGVSNKRARKSFLGMYMCWRYNTVSTLSLCLLSCAYEHAFQLIQFIGNSEMSASTLFQLERLVQLIEAPVFSYVRMALMEPSKCLPLVQTLFALQLILPQSSSQYTPLYRRLKNIPSLVKLEQEAMIQQKGNKEQSIKWEDLLKLSREAQECIADFERRLFLQRLGDSTLP